MRDSAARQWAAGPERPIPYGICARLADRWAGRRDGRAGVPAAVGAADHPADGVSPYQAALARKFLDGAERERLAADIRTAASREQLEAIRGALAAATSAWEAAVARLGETPESAPADELRRRGVLEKDADDALVATRRRREWTRRREPLVAEARRTASDVQLHRVREATVAGTIAVQERIAATRVRRLREHTLRRCSTYERQLVLHHPDGASLLPLVHRGRPALPAWARDPDAGEVTVADPRPSHPSVGELEEAS